MKLVRRLALRFLIVVGLVFAADTWLSLRLHLDLFDADLRRDERLLGGALAAAVERAWRDHGVDYATELLRDANDREGQVQIRLVNLEAAAGSPDGPAVSPSEMEFRRGDRAVAQVREESGEERFYTYVSLALPSPAFALELSESLTHERLYFWDRIRRKLATAGLMIVACSFVAWIVGVRLVGRPIDQLVAKARRIGSGDFGGPVAIREGDEFASLGLEMNAMADRLAAAKSEVADQSAARLLAIDQLRHADRLTTVGKLASGIAHELGTPLNVISGRARMITDGEVRGEEKTAENARIIFEQAGRMTRIVRQLLDFARRGDSEKVSIDLVDLVAKTLALLEPLATKKGVSLTQRPRSGSVLVRVDPGQIQQALTNLVVNAIQAARSGGHVTVDVAPTPPEASDGGWPLVGHAVVEVSDDGEGIAADHLAAIFDPFFTTKPVGEGSGLGLSVTYGILKEHGGWIEVASEPGRGSSFRMHLPRAASP